MLVARQAGRNEDNAVTNYRQNGDWRPKIKLHTSGAFTGEGFAGDFAKDFQLA